uniref:SAM domain-containing protein n=1 Tax=Macrostomum lignano TaxID=282301 RepID=A0A1I8GVG3_9PLAT
MSEFELGMVLEGVDPCHESLICCLSISEIQGCRLRLHFEGYTELHDFWCSADSPFLFPVGWAKHNGFPLQPPKGYEAGSFNWFDYIMTNKLRAVPRCLFSVPWDLPLPDHFFSEGQKLEAVDPRNPDHICVATVAIVMANRICIHFDGWDNTYDFWTKVDSPTIHPVGWCEQHDRALSLPEEWCRQVFTWDRYLESTCSEPVMPAAFRPRQPIPFDLGMKLEFVDPRNTRLVRIGTVVDPNPYPGFLQILPDGWGEKFAFITLDSSMELLPVGYCHRTGHPLEPLPTWHDSEKFTCPTVGCRGLGHVKGPGYKSHSSIKSCPYAERNWHRELPDRLELEADEAASGGAQQSNDQQPIRGSKLSNKRSSQGNSAFPNQSSRQASPHHQRPGSPGCPFYRSVFSPSISQYDPCKDTGPLVWPEHTQLIPSLASIDVSEVPRWSVAETSDLVRQLPGCEPFADAFIVEEIDGDAFLHLQQVDLLSILKMPLGPAIKLAQAIAAIKECLEQA